MVSRPCHRSSRERSTNVRPTEVPSSGPMLARGGVRRDGKKSSAALAGGGSLSDAATVLACLPPGWHGESTHASQWA